MVLYPSEQGQKGHKSFEPKCSARCWMRFIWGNFLCFVLCGKDNLNFPEQVFLCIHMYVRPYVNTWHILCLFPLFCFLFYLFFFTSHLLPVPLPELIHIHVLHFFHIPFLLSLPEQCGWSVGFASSGAGAGDEPTLHFNTQCCPASFLAPPNPDIWLWLLNQRIEPGHTPGQTALLPGAAHCRWSPARQLPHLLQRTHLGHRRLGSYRSVMVGN